VIRLLWLAPERVDPEESFGPLKGRRPAPEPAAFADAANLLPKSLADVILVDGRGRPAEAAAVVRKLRNDSDAPFLVVLSPADLNEFDWTCGAADFVTEGCTPEELHARIVRLAQPFEPEPAEVLRRGDITINKDRFEVRVKGEVLDLTFKEFVLLEYLASRPGKVCNRRELLTEVWGYEFFGGTRTVDVHVRRLRAKLGPAAQAIDTVRNVGYRFVG
jgi:DNA-binding response OmpR family regulator